MSINVLLAVTDATWSALKKNFQWVDPTDPSQGRVREDLTVDQARKLRDNRTGFWKAISASGDNYTVISLDVPENTIAEDDPKLVWIEFLTNKWPGKFIVLGAWKKKDRRFSPPYGIEIRYPDYDENGDPITTPPDNSWSANAKYSVWWRGSQVYPQHAQLMNAMPDDVTYDAGGVETSRAPSADFKEVHNVLGNGPRMFT